MTTQTPAGWYPDPYGSPQLRWWDGGQWTDATHPLEQPAPPEQGSGPQFPPGPSWTDHPANPTLTYGEPLQGQGQYGQPDHTEPSGPQFTPPPGGSPYGGAPLTSPAPDGSPYGGAQSGPQFGPQSGPQSGPQFGPQSGPQQGVPQFAPPPQSGPQYTAPQYGAPPQYTVPGAAQQPPGYGPPRRESNPLPWVFGGLAALVVVGLIVVGAIFFVNRGSGRPTADDTYVPQPPTTGQTQEPPPSTSVPQQLPQPQDGRITDPVAGLSYAPPSGWQVPDIADVNGTDPQAQAWSSAVQQTAQAKYNGKSDWIGNVYTGVLNDLFPYGSSQDLQNLTGTVFIDFQKYYDIQHTQKIVQSKAIKIGDKDAWVLQFKLDFSAESKKKGYKWNTENGAIVLMDRGEGERPAIFYMSVPDNLGTNVVEQVLASLKPA
ncbi:DUF2510 domain-containing protein [Nonomuraea sp. NPDC050536]|uniref:DUF2510 domain-containing protein n=1 Tax=Nonomuraea sp. NPDC050536 TaxID=3364366 RepID=UPI0037CC0CC1